MGFSAALLIVDPAFGQIQFAVQQRVPTRTGVGKKDAYLAVFNASSRATVLSLDADRDDEPAPTRSTRHKKADLRAELESLA
jgi:hypothetical protein